jgi:hypothetical protein
MGKIAEPLRVALPYGEQVDDLNAEIGNEARRAVGHRRALRRDKARRQQEGAPTGHGVS